MRVKYKAWDDENEEWTDELEAEVQAEPPGPEDEAKTTATELATCLTGLGCASQPWRVIKATGTCEDGVAWIEYGRHAGILVWGSAL